MKLLNCAFTLCCVVAMCSLVQAKSLEENVAMCNDCHGPDGISGNGDVPTIAGFSATALADVFAMYQDGSRPKVNSKYYYGDTARPETNMVDITNALSEEEIEALAEHYSYDNLEYAAAEQSFDAAKATMGEGIHDDKCGKCHADGGTDPDDDVPLLGGQWMPYLKMTMEHYKTDKRDSDTEMIKKIKQLNADEVDALMHYYASLQ